MKKWRATLQKVPSLLSWSYVNNSSSRRTLFARQQARPDAVCRCFIILNGFFNQAYKNEIIKKNPVPLTQFPKYPPTEERRVMSKEEQNIFLEYTRTLYYGDIFEVALSTGMRNGELRGLEWSDVDFEKKIIHITHTLRHTFATRCIEKGMQPQVLKSILGHSSLAMTMDLYSYVLPDTKSEEMMKISDLF